MRSKVHFLLLAAISCLSQTILAEEKNEEDNSRNKTQKLLLVSMDGFRHDYFKKAKTPNFDAMKKSGATVPYVTPPFVPEAFPSHHSMATGLYPESHGIVGNSFYDPLYKDVFTRTHMAAFTWWMAAEPIWISAVKAGLRVGTLNWPGSDVNFESYRPTAYRRYQPDIPYDVRIRTVIDWLALMDFDLCMLYFEEPDQTGHKTGPDDPRLLPVIERMDSVLGWLMTSLEKAGIKDKVDVIVTSDHGMTNITEKEEEITDASAAELVTMYNQFLKRHAEEETLLHRLWFSNEAHFYLYGDINPRIYIYWSLDKPDKVDGKKDEFIAALKKVEHLTAYLREDIPERFHYKNNRRVSDFLAIADEGWMVTYLGLFVPHKGMHGYDNNLTSMRTIFVASGPSFSKGYRHSESIETVDIYPLICHLLNLEPAPNNGSLERVKPLLLRGNGALDKAASASPYIITSSWVILTRVF